MQSSNCRPPVRASRRGVLTTARSNRTVQIQVFDIWESQADFDAFGPTLMPILTELGVGLKEPMVATRSQRDNRQSLRN